MGEVDGVSWIQQTYAPCVCVALDATQHEEGETYTRFLQTRVLGMWQWMPSSLRRARRTHVLVVACGSRYQCIARGRKSRLKTKIEQYLSSEWTLVLLD
jgi:hypothetical protein